MGVLVTWVSMASLGPLGWTCWAFGVLQGGHFCPKGLSHHPRMGILSQGSPTPSQDGNPGVKSLTLHPRMDFHFPGDIQTLPDPFPLLQR